ncbi:PDZ domain-containing protein [Bifidobacterium myosotis]|uniref:YlbL family protein n=1 Tax=Bifidobacterium myosotis TaxID=1630166 RepID=UPI000B9A5BAB|nr:S16 family serine protease [Bifidobacterium myosotis]
MTHEQDVTREQESGAEFRGRAGWARHPGRAARAAVARVRRYVAGRSVRYFTGILAVALGAAILLMPSPYVIEMPGPTQDVLGSVKEGQVIAVGGKDVSTHRDSGKLLLVTVSASGVPGYPIVNAQAVWGWADSQVEVTPREAVVPVGQTADEYQQKVDADMTGSQDTATKAAIAYLKAHGAELGVDAAELGNLKVTMHVDSIGGPSAGMMYTLGLIDKLTAAQETGGKTIAGTGTISEDGAVGRIGGIRLKMLGARRDGATWFLAPESNCAEVVGHVPDGLRDVKVATLDEAYQALVAIGAGKADGLSHCTA